MKGFAFIVLMVSSTNYFTPKEKESINYDENRQLTWSDYQARPNKASSFLGTYPTGLYMTSNP